MLSFNVSKTAKRGGPLKPLPEKAVLSFFKPVTSSGAVGVAGAGVRKIQPTFA